MPFNTYTVIIVKTWKSHLIFCNSFKYQYTWRNGSFNQLSQKQYLKCPLFLTTLKKAAFEKKLFKPTTRQQITNFNKLQWLRSLAQASNMTFLQLPTEPSYQHRFWVGKKKEYQSRFFGEFTSILSWQSTDWIRSQ